MAMSEFIEAARVDQIPPGTGTTVEVAGKDGLRYDVTTGQVTTGGLGVASYPVKVVDGKIFITVE
jgi:hypothetical protein